MVQSTVMEFDSETGLEAPAFVLSPEKHHKRDKEDLTAIADARHLYKAFGDPHTESQTPVSSEALVIPKPKTVNASVISSLP